MKLFIEYLERLSKTSCLMQWFPLSTWNTIPFFSLVVSKHFFQFRNNFQMREIISKIVIGLCYSVSLALPQGLQQIKGRLFLGILFGEIHDFYSENLVSKGATSPFQNTGLVVKQRHVKNIYI